MVHVELFAGGGGFLRGAVQAGLSPTVAVENRADALLTLQANFPGTRVIGEPVQQVDWPALARELGEVDLLTAGPPCEPFTPINRDRRADPLDRLYTDPVGGLVLHTIKAIRALAPRAFVIENVVQLIEGPLEAELADLLDRAGYQARFHVLRAEEHGTPSTRTRVFISNVELDPPTAPGGTVREAIEDLEDLDAPVENHTPEALPKGGRDQLAGLAPGESLQRWRGASGKVYGNWTRIAYDAPAPTVRGSGRFVHPELDRGLSPREHARLMGFPDEHVFHGSKKMTYEQVGEAVPVPLGCAILSDVRGGLESR